MFKKILVALDRTAADEAILPRAADLARLTGAELLLVHVADGWVARNYEQLKLADSEEIREDRAYLESTAARLREQGVRADSHLAMGDPARGLLAVVTERNCDLIAMASHGHKLIGDIIHGQTIEKVRHEARVPMFIVRAESLK